MILNDYDYDVLPREFKRSEKTAGALQLVPYHSPIVPSATRCYLAAPCSFLLLVARTKGASWGTLPTA